ncbi:family 20 glycosylhydrolase [Chryseobacterium sp. Bi04]|uniref:glycoside hydrolase family 20 protein n=1 Tax=Chryseobacterium sp. Bi04 TaxID=2822345 RepID=UPI001DC29CDC|nr:family 20 glycosylhydrolase [Chryseobacterium sp. Bi04]CAH0164987.1 Beta-hexosaminidase [Chryseobacterium sp. Bi04]
MLQHTITTLLSLFLFSQTVFAQAPALDIIPKPNKINYLKGGYSIPSKPTLYVVSEFKGVADLLSEHPAIQGYTIKIIKKTDKTPNTGIRLITGLDTDRFDDNTYRIEVGNNGIMVKARNTKLMINAIYTLIQIAYLQNNPQFVPAIEIEDSPRFSYRGMMLDVSRHFMPFSSVKKFVDVMALYKFNYLHLHLTDGAGWRLQILKYPELTHKAAWRTHTNWKDWWNNGRQYVEQGTPNASGGYYTQDQARELVAYAARKGITVIPEIEMPAHSDEVLALFPQLSCTGQPYTQGEFCIGNEETFIFLKNVLDEVIAIFPSPYIHIGGDEASKEHWKTCPKDQALMKKEGLKNEEELQSYAIKKMDQYLQSKGRKLLGWDEILEGGLSEGATVMSWRGEKGGIKAANAGHDVIMTPASHLYFDGYQTDPRTQPEAFGGPVTLDRVYSYDPIPSAITTDKAKHVLGAQANLWAEYMPTYQHVEYMAFPRALALSEVVWSKKTDKNWEDFQARLQKHYTLLQKLDINYYRPSYTIRSEVTFNPEKHSNLVTLHTEQINPEIRYTLDGSDPAANSMLYSQPIDLSITSTIKAAIFLNSTRVGSIQNIELDMHKGIGKNVIYQQQWDGYPAQKELTLTNGKKGGLSYSDGEWQGFTKDIDVTVDFEKKEEIKSIAMNFMQMPGPGVYFPGEFVVSVSDNGKTFRDIGTVKNDVGTDDSKLKFKKFELKLPNSQATRFVRIKATNPMKGYLFTDEIIIY